MREVYVIDRNTQAIRQDQKILIVFKGNVDSIGPAIPFIAFFIAGIFIYYLYVSDSMKVNSETILLVLTFIFLMILTLLEITLKYEIDVNRDRLSLSTSRLGIKVEKKISIRQTISIEKIEVIGQIGNSVIYRTKLCISDRHSKNIVPVTLDDDSLDEVAKLIQDAITQRL
jgi:hypothetical protein